MTWVDLLVGLTPFALIAMLLWIRLRIAGVSTVVAVKFIAKVFALIATAILGLGCIAKGWWGKESWLLVIGTIITVLSFLVLRWKLQRAWEEFPLLSGESRQDDGANN